MVADGLIFIDPRNQPGVTNWNIALTEKGEKAVLGEEWLPEDVDSYLTRLCGKIPGLDRAIEMYMKEAILAFNGSSPTEWCFWVHTDVVLFQCQSFTDAQTMEENQTREQLPVIAHLIQNLLDFLISWEICVPFRDSPAHARNLNRIIRNHAPLFRFCKRGAKPHIGFAVSLRCAVRIANAVPPHMHV